MTAAIAASGTGPTAQLLRFQANAYLSIAAFAIAFGILQTALMWGKPTYDLNTRSFGWFNILFGGAYVVMSISLRRKAARIESSATTR